MPRLSAEDRLKRLLALVPWVVEQGNPTVQDVCRRFGLTEKELAADLDLLFMCGLHPYTPDMLIETEVADGRVRIAYAEYFARPLRLTPPEGFVLLATGRTMLALPGADPDGPLARGLAKLAAVLGIGDPASLDVDPGDVDEALLDTLNAAVRERRAVDLAYYSFGRDEQTRRVVEPLSVFSSHGQWYLAARCRTVEDERVFRLDRIRKADVLEEQFDPPATRREHALYTPRDDDPRIVLDLDPPAHWVATQYPVEHREDLDDGRVRVRLAVSEQAWLDRLMLRVGCHATVVEGEASAAGIARRVLDRYRAEGGVR